MTSARRFAEQARVTANARSRPRRYGAITRIAAGVDGYPEGRDAAALGAGLAAATAAELILVSVHPDPLVVLPSGMDWKSLHHDSEKVLREIRATLAPGARTLVETDFSSARALHRVVCRERRDLLVLGSSRHGPEGRVRIGKRTRQLLCQFECPLAIAPRGLHERAPFSIRKVGGGYDDGPEAEAAVALADSIALAAGADLLLRAVVDDRVPWPLRTALDGLASVAWVELLKEHERQLGEQGTAAARASRSSANFDVFRGRPADALLALSHDVDLLVIGSRRWGPAARVLLGSTGEALLHDAACPVLVVPRPGDEVRRSGRQPRRSNTRS